MEYEGNDFSNDHISRERGKRAEEVAEWYFRINGFFLIPGFIVHPDTPCAKPRTEADLLGIRLKDSTEGIWRAGASHHFRRGTNRTSMSDDRILTSSALVGTVKHHLVAMVEVKAGLCAINGPWSDRMVRDRERGKSNMERALGRVGFGNREEISRAADSMYEALRYEGNNFVVQYFTVGRRVSDDLKNKYPKLVQISFDHVGEFLLERFSNFPEKIPNDSDIQLWEGFGGWFLRWFEANGYRNLPSVIACQRAVLQYIDHGK